MTGEPISERKTRGRPPFRPTDHQRRIVAVLSAMGLSHDSIRMVIVNEKTGRAIERPTLLKAFAEEIEIGRAHTDYAVATAIVEGIKRGDVRFASLYARNRLGWDTKVAKSERRAPSTA